MKSDSATKVDDSRVIEDFRLRIVLCTFPDSFILASGVRYTVELDDNLWDIVKKFHAGRVPVDDYHRLAIDIAAANQIADPDLILPGQQIELPWHGLPEADSRSSRPRKWFR